MATSLAGTADDLAYWLALQRTPTVGPVTFRALLERFGSPRAVFDAARGERSSASGLPAEARDYLRAPDWGAVDRDLAWCQCSGNHIVTMQDEAYPALLGELSDAPPLIYVRGDPGALALPQLAVVGSRNPSASGRETAHEFARYLARAGLAVVSGLAIGIDAAAHEGALAADGATIAVAGTGLDRVYPARHRELAHQIAARGALVSELPPGTPPVPENFPRRNRIISGLSLGTLVVEAALRSGSLITARLASEQGREVFAIPGSIHNPVARGCHQLIRDGAKLVETAADIIEELGPLARYAMPPPGIAQGPEVRPAPDKQYAELLEHLGFEPVLVDTLVERSGLTPDAVSSMLLVLELHGHVTQAPDGYYTRVTKRTT